MEKGEVSSEWKIETAKAAFVAASAVLVGAVFLEKDASVWYGSVLRGDLNSIRIGARSNIQDGTVLHVTHERGVQIASEVTVGHGAILHGCIVERECLIGMGAILLDGAWIGEGSVVAAGSLVPEGQKVPPGSLVIGIPAKVVRSIRPDERERIRDLAASYVELALLHASMK